MKPIPEQWTHNLKLHLNETSASWSKTMTPTTVQTGSNSTEVS